ncbi:MAG: molybdopterin-guanine dinucleotide biosynthesis protein B [Thermoplasmatota archaeon]
MIIVALIGLKKSGKTTTAQALIREFHSRGYRVGGVKVMPLSGFTIDTEGKDTRRHMEAGADVVISLSSDEMAYIEKRERPAKIQDALKLIPGDIDVLVCEGLNDDVEGAVRIVVAREKELLADTLETRGIRKGVIALTGIMSNETGTHPEYPVFNCTVPEEASALVDLIMEESETSDL